MKTEMKVFNIEHVYMGGEQNNGNTKKSRNRIYVSYIESTSVDNTKCSSIWLYSVVLMQYISDCVEWQNQKMGDLSNIERGHIIGAHLPGVSMTKLPHHRVYQEWQFLRLCQHTRVMGNQRSKRNSGRKSTFTKRECNSWGLFWKITQLL
jgi:hypothetical protein